MNIVDVKRHFDGQSGRVYGWQTISVDEARKLPDPRVRCPECKGQVGLFSASENGRMPYRAEHRTANPGCSLGDCFNGTQRMASLPIEPELDSYRD